jgi:hypothetical protein
LPVRVPPAPTVNPPNTVISPPVGNVCLPPIRMSTEWLISSYRHGVEFDFDFSCTNRPRAARRRLYFLDQALHGKKSQASRKFFLNRFSQTGRFADRSRKLSGCKEVKERYHRDAKVSHGRKLSHPSTAAPLMGMLSSRYRTGPDRRLRREAVSGKLTRAPGAITPLLPASRIVSLRQGAYFLDLGWALYTESRLRIANS